MIYPLDYTNITENKKNHIRYRKGLRNHVLTLQPDHKIYFLTDRAGMGELGDLSTGVYPSLGSLLDFFLGKITAWEPVRLPDGFAQ